MTRSKRTSSRAIIVLAVLLLAAVVALVAAIGSQGFTIKNAKKWFKGWGNPDNVGDAGDDISISTYALAVEDYADYGISEQAIEAGVLTVQYKPANTTNKRTGWTFRFAGNAWSQGKVLSDYVVFTAGANYAPECTYEVLKPFGDTIIVEATSRANSSLKATTNIDYLARFQYFWGGDGTSELALNAPLNVFERLDCDGKPYSIVPTSYSANITITLDNNLWNWIQENIDDKPQKVWSYENCQYLANVTGAISWSDWFDDNGGGFIDSDFAAYYDETGRVIFGRIEAEITCYYNGEEMYTFTDGEYIEFTVESIEAVSVYPTEISPNVEHVVI